MRNAMIAELLTSMPPISLSSGKFFVPKRRFLSYMETFKGHTIYDLGAGMGQVSAALHAAGHQVVALDCNTREETEFPITLGNAISQSYESGSVLMFCRPSHGLWVEIAIERALAFHPTAIVYVGLVKNLECDLGAYLNKFKKKAKNIGAESENLYVWEIM